MVVSPQRFYKRIVINIDSDSSEDEAPPCKIKKIQYPTKDIIIPFLVPSTKRAPEETSLKQKRLKESGESTLDINNAVTRKRRSILVAPCLPRNRFSVFYQQAIANTPLYFLHQNASQVVQHLSSVATNERLTLHYSKSVAHMEKFTTGLLMLIEESTERNRTEFHEQVNSIGAVLLMIQRSAAALWASFMLVIIHMWSVPYNGLFVKSVGIVMQNIHSQVSSLHVAIKLLNSSLLVQHDSLKQDVEAVCESIINITLLLHSLLMKKNFLLEGFVFLVIDIALLPPLRYDERMMLLSLHLVRSVLKFQIAYWEKCTLKICMALFKSCDLSEVFFAQLESGRKVHRYTLLLLTLIQSSIRPPGNWLDSCYRVSLQSLSSSKKHILEGLVQDECGMEYLKQSQKTFLKALEHSVVIVNSFFGQVQSALLLAKSDHHLIAFKRVLDDLLSLTDDVQWPAAEYTLILLCNLLVTTLMKEKLPRTSCKFVFECLTSILFKFNNHFASLEAQDSRSLPLLKKALLAYLEKDFGERDWCLVYVVLWHMDYMTGERTSEKTKTITVNRDNVQHVVKSITALRRTSDIKNILKKIVFLVDLNQKLSPHVITLVTLGGQLNAEIFLEEHIFSKVISLRCNENPVNRRKALVRCLTAFLLHRPDRFDSYFEIFRSYISDKATSVRNTALEGMKMIGFKYYNQPKVLKKLLLLVKIDGDYSQSAAQMFCKLTWLKPVKKIDGHGLLKNKVSMLIDMFALITDSSSIEELFPLLFRLDEDEPRRTSQLNACAQIVTELSAICLEKKVVDNAKTIASIKLLNLFAEITPEPLVSKCFHLFLSRDRERLTDVPNVELTNAVAKTFKTVLSCNQNDNSAFYYDIFMDGIEESRMANESRIASGLEKACLVANLQQSYSFLETLCELDLANIYLLDTLTNESHQKTCLLQRNVFSLGVVCKEISKHCMDMNRPLADQWEDIFQAVLAKCFNSDADLKQTALFALGGVTVFHSNEIITKNVQGVLLEVLDSEVPSGAPVILQALRTICDMIRPLVKSYETTFHHDMRSPLARKRSKDKSLISKNRNFIKTIVNTYFESAMNQYNHRDKFIRYAVFEILLVVGQSDVIPCIEIITALLAMFCDPEKSISAGAEKWVRGHAARYSECIPSAVEPALTVICGLSLNLSGILSPVEGYSIEKGDSAVAKLSKLNSIVVELTGNQVGIIPYVVRHLLNRQDTCPFDLLFYAGNLAHFKYQKRSYIVSIIIEINAKIVAVDAVVNGFQQVLKEAADGRTSSLSVHSKRVRKALKLLLLTELKSFLEKVYQIQIVELLKFESDQPYKIPVTFGEKTTWVSNKSKGNPICLEASKLRFSSRLSSAEAIKDSQWEYCCGQNYSTRTLILLYRQLRKMYSEH